MMPTITLKFYLPEDKCTADIAFHAMGFALTCLDLDNELRKYQKYGHKFTLASEAIDKIRSSLHDILDGRGVSLDMIE